MPSKEKEIAEVKAKVREKKPPEKIDYSKGLSTGSTLLNLACSGRPSIGFLPGKYYFVVGDSSSGKSFLFLTCLAEASVNPLYKDYRFIYDDAEDGALMNFSKFFGKRMAERVEPPAVDRKGSAVYSSNIEEFYFNLDDAANEAAKGRPFIYILDSMDSISSEDENKKFLQNKKIYRKAQKDSEEDGEDSPVEMKGSFGDGKAKKNSANLRRFVPILRKTGSILLIVCQAKDNVGTFSFEKRTRSGGRAIKYYAALEMWTSIRKRLKKELSKGRERQIGITCLVEVKKNRLNGKERSVEFPIYHSFGIDDTGGCVEFLVKEKHWAASKGIIEAPEFKFRGTAEKLIAKIEEEGKERELKQIVTECWMDIEQACEIHRKKRY